MNSPSTNNLFQNKQSKGPYTRSLVIDDSLKSSRTIKSPITSRIDDENDTERKNPWKKNNRSNSTLQTQSYDAMPFAGKIISI